MSPRAVLALATVALAFLAAQSSAQQPPANTVILLGTVTDASTGAGVSGALVSVADRGPRAIADAQGRFRLVDVPIGSQELVVERFGYVSLEVNVVVTATPQPLELRMTPDPLQLQGLTVLGNAKAPLSGTVMDAVSSEPLPWSEIWLSRDAVREAGRATADAQGVFSISDVTTGAYLVRVEKLGYVGQIIPIGHAAPPEPMEVRLQPDSVMLKGLAAMNARLDTRRRASSGEFQSFDEGRLRTSVMRGMQSFLESDAMIPMMPCGTRAMNDCRALRGRLVTPRVYIDEVSAAGLAQLWSYDPGDFYSVDIFVCGPADRMGGWEIRAYSRAFMERQATRARGVFASCLLP